MNLHFQIPRLPGNAFSDHVFNFLRKGDPVELTGPGGDFILDEKSTHPLVFIAWRTGFGPIRSLVEQAMALDITDLFACFGWPSINKTGTSTTCADHGRTHWIILITYLLMPMTNSVQWN